MRKNSPMRKLVAAILLLAISAGCLVGSTYAWFTMNKEVSVTGMQVKAHAEEGLLINEVAAADSQTWDDQATGGAAAAVVMRPASTYDLATWWHANSKLSADEAGVENLDNTVDITGVGKYLNISPANVSNNPVYASGVGNTHAETHVFYKDASFGTSGSYQDGEGFYVMYTYYLKSSGDSDLSVSDLQVKVKATQNSTGANASGTVSNIDPALRVGVVMPIAVGSSTNSKSLIFAPIPGTGDSGANATNNSYNVTTVADGTSTQEVTPVVASGAATYTNYTTLNNTSVSITIPKVTSNGIPVYVYVWYEGEDTHCMSDNLIDAIAAYDIDISFNCDDIGGAGSTT